MKNTMQIYDKKSELQIFMGKISYITQIKTLYSSICKLPFDNSQSK